MTMVPTLLFLLWIAEACSAYKQLPLGHSSSDCRSSPFDEVFNEKVIWALRHFQVPGLSIAVVHGNETFLKGYGVSDLSTGSPVTEDMHFIGGSTTKAFTAAAISLLVDDNENFPEIQWDTPIHRIIPEDFVLNDDWYTTHVTIADALSHRSGIPRHDMTWVCSNITLREGVRNMRHLPITAPIRTMWQYSNLMYMSVAHIIETVTGQWLGDFFRERIWEPLGMTDTYLSVDDALAVGAEISRGYYLNLTGDLEDLSWIPLDHVRGAGHIISSARDYAKWASAMIHRAPPFSPEAHATLVSAHSIMVPIVVEPESAPQTYGLGWMIHSYRGEVIIEHGGAEPGFGTLVLYLPNREWGLTIFTNNMIGGTGAEWFLAYHLIDELLETLEEERFDWVTRSDKQIYEVTTITEEKIQKLYPSLTDPPLRTSLPLSAYEGIYVHPAYPTLNISRECGEISLFPRSYKSDKGETISLWNRQSLCAMIPSAISDAVFELRHASGDYWFLAYELWGEVELTRAEFKLGPDGAVKAIGVKFEQTMIDNIWLQREG
ncbi:hypothetical protein VTN77DRAFT_3997 [Rasamsonia byssochlamydoides]|uniref:uncharacterized protein n=1 Tax=Rasamsonia byssochlamydoides TaxID=89139 RepID=UPI0037447084